MSDHAGATPSGTFRAVDHVAVVVTDMDEALRSFDAVLGLPIVSDDSLTDPPVRLVHLDAGNLDIQLVQPLGRGRVAEDLAARGPGLHHICFGVGNLTSTLESIGEDTTGVFAAPKARPACFLRRSPAQVPIEVIEFADSDTPGSFAAASERIRAYWLDESARALPAILQHFGPDAVVECPGLSASGLEEVSSLYRHSLESYPGLRVEVTNQFNGRGSHAFEYEAILTDADGVEWEVKGINVVTLRDGRIQYMRSYEDQPSRR